VPLVWKDDSGGEDVNTTVYTLGLGNDTEDAVASFAAKMVGSRAVVVDVRRVTVSRQPFDTESKRRGEVRHTRELLSSACIRTGIEYTWRPALAPSAALLREAKAGLQWKEYAVRFLRSMEYLEARKGFAGLNLLASQNHLLVLLCSEKRPKHCHRRLLAEKYARDYTEETGLDVWVHNLVIGEKTEPYVPVVEAVQSKLW
jgi:uncharacterized protein (DUF488 family)